MITERGPIGMGDAVTAARALHLTELEDLDLLVELLGLRQVEHRADPTPTVRRSAGAGTSRTVSAVIQAEGEVVDHPESALRTLVEPLPPEPVAPISYVPAEPLSMAPARRRVAYRPIMPPHQLRAALTMIIRRPRPSVRLDVEAAVELIAERRPLDQLPRLVEQTVDGGVTIIADVGPEMLPYLDDVDHLVDSARHIAGESTTRVAWVEDSGDVPAFIPDRTVLVISTLGAAHAPGAPPGAPTRWRHQAQELVAAEADVTALVPHRRRPRTEQLDGVRVVAWDDLGEVGRGRA